MLTIEEDLRQYAQDFYISKNSPEKPKIEASLKNIRNKLEMEFGDRILAVEVFGSYKRKTILPRNYDSRSDIDLLIVFDHENINVNPSTYRKYLLEFAEEHYPNSISYKSQPSVYTERKLESLQANAEKVSEALEDEDIDAAMRWLGRILPIN